MTELEVKIDQLRKIVYGSLNQPTVRNLASALTFGLNNPTDKVQAIYNWVKRRIRYVPESAGRDVALRPETTIGLSAGDCEDHAMLISTLAKLSGIQTRFKVISRDGNLYTHIFSEALVNGRWIPLDTTIPLPLGGEPAYYKARTYVL